MSQGRISEFEHGRLIPGRGPMLRLCTALEVDFLEFWRYRAAELVAIRYEQGIRRLKLDQRAAVADIERAPDEDRDIRIRRPLPVDPR